MTDESPPRMLHWLLLTVVLLILAVAVQTHWPGTLVAVSLYKAQLMCLGGWGGYWLDRALFPYARPHEHLIDDAPSPPDAEFTEGAWLGVTSTAYPMSMLRRAIITAGCLVCVGLGA